MTSAPQTTLDKPDGAQGDADSPYHVMPAADPTSPLLFICDHASNAIPKRYANLGLSPNDLKRHIAYDPGAAEVTERLARHFGATAVFSRFSRLLIDPNRGEDDPTLLMRIADRAVVPGNRSIDARERQARLEAFYRPYHQAVTTAINEKIAQGIGPVLISIHSFTERWRGTPRPWHIGVLWAQDGRVAQPLLEALGKNQNWVIGDNAPYSGELQGDTMWRHGTQRQIPHALLEVRQDLIRTSAGQQEWSDHLANALEEALSQYLSGKTV